MERYNLNAIILAAGEGTRLNPLTKNYPKGLVLLFGKSLIERQLEIFRACDITDISIVTGYLGEMIKFSDITYFHNPNYRSTNMVETLLCARQKLTDSTIVSYGDIIFERKILEKLICSQDDISVIIDTEWYNYWKARFENPLGDAESLILKDGFISNIGQKTQNLSEIQGQYIGLMKFQNEGIRILQDFYDKSKELAKTSTNPLNSRVPFEKSYLTDLLQGLINEGHKIKAIPTKNGWLELDSYNDFQLYEKLQESNQLSKFINLQN